jgi:excinuclease ABC subunit B
VEHGITPRGIQKSVSDILEGAYAEAPGSVALAKVAEGAGDYSKLAPEQLQKRIKKLEQEMFKHARNLEFEEAARLRDEVQKLRKLELGLAAGR